MKFAFPFLAFAVSIACGSPAAPDMLLFANGDRVRGSFMGFDKDGAAALSRDGMKDPMRFDTRGLRQLVLRDGVPAQPTGRASRFVLRSGESIQGILRFIDDSSIVVETPFAGPLSLPRKDVAVIQPEAAGGAGLLYVGPFRTDGWLNFSDPSVARTAEVPAVGAEHPHPAKPANVEADGKESATKGPADGRKDGWRFEGNSWFWAGGNAAALLALPEVLPDRFVCTMDLEWTGWPYFSIGYHAGMEPLEKPFPDRGRAKKRPLSVEERQSSFQILTADEVPGMMGNAVGFMVQHHGLSLDRIMWGKGNRGCFPLTNPLQATGFEGGGGMENYGQGVATIGRGNRCRLEIRADRSKMMSQILIDGRMRFDWQEVRSEQPGQPGKGTYGATGKALCFVVHQPSSTLRISGIRISDWDSGSEAIRGIDNAESKDVLVLADGSDRMAGSMLGLKDGGTLSFKGSYGELAVPLQRIGEIRLAEAGKARSPAAVANEVQLSLGAAGSLRGRILPDPDARHFLLRHPLFGELRVLRDAVSMIEFGATGSSPIGTSFEEESSTP